LRISEEKFSTLFRSSPISITVSDLNDQDRFLDVNEAFEKFTGHSRESVIGKTYPPEWLWPDPQEYAEALAQLTASGQLNGFQFHFRRTSGEVRNGQLWARAIEFGGKQCLVAETIDITERKQAEEDRIRLQQQLAHAQKMECVGRLAGGIAHDFNNLMSVILMHADSAMDELDSADAVRESITAIEDAVQKAIALGRQLMSFSRNQVVETELLNLSSVIVENHKMIRRLIGEDVKVELNPGPGLLVRADRGQLGQVIVNLAVNSRDAMPEGGTFEIQTCRVDFEAGDSRLPRGTGPGPYAALIVKDTGAGMDAETQARVFEPFFTTKGVGKGTGLGLSVVYGLVTQMGGFIALRSEPGKGTEFTIYLPLASGVPTPVAEVEKGPIPGGSETVLLSEDEPALRAKLQKVLAQAGYRVLVAADGGHAFHLCMEHGGVIDLLLTDVVMPDMSGYRLAERLQVLWPQVKVLYMSGYPNAADGGVAPSSAANFIQKPFSKERLLRRIRQALDN
jgi:PAS domain S-box-containing protein